MKTFDTRFCIYRNDLNDGYCKHTAEICEHYFMGYADGSCQHNPEGKVRKEEDEK